MRRAIDKGCILRSYTLCGSSPVTDSITCWRQHLWQMFSSCGCSISTQGKKLGFLQAVTE
ncbi:hypothetical protein KKG56_04330 [bacterium]|nr:hypothetical protein [bacterium]